MIPDDPEEIDALAGEYVLGVLDATAAREIEAALASDPALRRAVEFWEERLHPLSDLAPEAKPPADLWDRIRTRIGPPAPSLWNSIKIWRSAAIIMAALAGVLAAYIAVTPPAAPSLVAVLHAPAQEAPIWTASIGRDGLVLHAVADRSVPSDRDLELWGIALGTTRPQPLGIIPDNGRLVLSVLPPVLGDGSTLAISVEPKGGSPTGQPTGPVVYVGTLVKAS